MSKLYTIYCLQGAPLSSWSEPATLDSILDRYYEQLCDQQDDDEPKITRQQFTPQLFEDIWECRLEEKL